MEINRNQYFMVGTVLLLLGIQFRMVDTYVLNDKAKDFVASKMVAEDDMSQTGSTENAAAFLAPLAGGHFKPPRWLGWSIVSLGAVMILHALAMPKP